jgi:hypothetical protein
VLIAESGLSILSGAREYRNEMLNLAADLGYRLLPAFATKTKIPYGTVWMSEKSEGDESCLMA